MALPTSSYSIEFTSGLRIFELSNHLGNVLATLTDRKLHRDFNLNDTADFYLTDTTSFHDYYPYGMEKPGRGSNPTGYRFGFNGVEADNALMPGRTGYHTYFRQYDTRTARWFSVDPVVHPWQSPYNAMDGNPIALNDPLGAATGGGDPKCPGPANAPTGGESFKFENTIGFDPLAGIKNNISNPSTVNPPMQDNSVAVQNSYSFENNMRAEGGGEKGGGNILGNIDLGNGNVVNVYFANTKDGVNSNLPVSPSLVNAFNGAVVAASQSYNITSITISATTNGVHGPNSRHYAGNALDISMVNGIAVGPNQPVIGALQNAFELQSGRRENFGPALMMKLGQPYIHDGLSPSLYQQRVRIRNAHFNHIHWSVN